jgi:hypothetical protein
MITPYGVAIFPLDNGNVITISRDGGISLIDDSGGSVAGIDADGNLTGTDIHTTGTSTHDGDETFNSGITIPAPGGGSISITPEGGIIITDASGATVGGIDADGNITGADIITTGDSQHDGMEFFNGTVTIGSDDGSVIISPGFGITVYDADGTATASIDQDGNISCGDLETTGTSTHAGNETFNSGITIPTAGGGSINITPDGGVVITDASGVTVGGIDADGNITGVDIITTGDSQHDGMEFFNGTVTIGNDNGSVIISPGFGVTVYDAGGTATASIDQDGNVSCGDLETTGTSTHAGDETFSGTVSVTGPMGNITIDPATGTITVPTTGGGTTTIGPDGINIESADGWVEITDGGDITTTGKIHADGGIDPLMLESFDVDKSFHYETGDVLVIDPGSGRYRPSFREYDTGVVGVVAANPEIDEAGELLGIVMGAAGPSPAVLKGRERTFAYVKVDASDGAVRPGDLLTTSSTPGHAMKAENPRIGTILGKALEPISNGTGVIKAFIMLQ